VAFSVGLEDDLGHAAGICPTCRDHFITFGCATVQQNHIWVLLMVLSQILLEFECGHRPDIIMLRAPQTAETR
jgi:hypothetical protein